MAKKKATQEGNPSAEPTVTMVVPEGVTSATVTKGDPSGGPPTTVVLEVVDGEAEVPMVMEHELRRQGWTRKEL